MSPSDGTASGAPSASQLSNGERTVSPGDDTASSTLGTSPDSRGDVAVNPRSSIDGAPPPPAGEQRGQVGRSPRHAWRGLRGLPRRVPRAAWICALVAIVNGVCWSVIVPPFQIPDEPSHFAYAAHLAETGQLPSTAGEVFPAAETIVLNDVLQANVRFSQENHTISTETEQQALERGMTLLASRSEPGDGGLAAGQPPLYYALETIPYYIGWDGTVLDRLALMRLLSALMGGMTALFAFMFLREALPGARWAWTVGGLGVALAPLLGMMSGGVNPDALLFAVSAALFYLLARGFRRGMTRRLALCIGLTVAAGCLTKLTFLGLVPGAIAGLLALSFRQARVTSKRAALGSLAIALAVAVAPVLLYVVLHSSPAARPTTILSGAASLAGHKKSIFDAISHIWQLYLPRLPGMSPAYRGMSSALPLWFEGIVGKYGWLDTDFPRWVVKVALIPVVLIAALFARALVVGRAALLRRWTEVGVYAIMALGILILIGLDEYIHNTPAEYIQLRYTLPLVALLGIVLALAARGAGRRWGPTVGALLVVLILAHDLFSQLLTISRYYG